MSALSQKIFMLIHGLSGRIFFADVAGIFFAEYLPYLLVLGFFVLIFLRQGARHRLYLFAEGTMSVILARGLLTELIRLAYHEPRPFSFYGFAPLIGESGWSFPSGHMTFFFALAMSVWYANRRWGTWYFVFAGIMGVARIYAGVHWPFDILGGAAIGILSALFVHWLLKDGREGLLNASSPSPALLSER